MTQRPVKKLKVYVDKVSRLFYFGTIGNNRSNAKLLEEILNRKTQRRWANPNVNCFFGEKATICLY